MSVKQENRYRKMVISQGRAATDRQREFEAAYMMRGPKPPAAPPKPNAARRRDVRRWMQHNACDYSNETELAEAANVIFHLPGCGLDDETHWVWDEAADAMEDSE